MKCTDLDRLSQTAREHAQHPCNLGPLSNADGHARVTGPCGDTMEFWVTVADGKVTEASFTTDGCGPSLACGSITTVLAKGRPVEDAACLRQEDIVAALGDLPEEHWHCALLAANTLNAACQGSLRRQQELQKAPRDPQATCDTCGEKDCSAAERKKDESDEEFKDRRQLQSRLCRIRHKVVVLSGKGGVGKSTVAVNLAVALMMAGKRVGLLDVDIHGPSIPTMLGLEHEHVQGSADGLIPVDVDGLKVMSIGFFLNDQDDAVIWRGPLKMGVIKQFLKDVDWGDLDYLIIDSPPGTGDEPLSVCQLIGKLDGAIVVTTPQKVAAVDVRKSVNFCRQLKVPVLGVVENMSGFACPKCGEVTQVFRSGAGQEIARDMLVPFLGAIPLDPQVAEACDTGRAFVHHYVSTPTTKAMLAIVRPVLALEENDKHERKDKP
jgi:Mrp family chromosome partitioning ATPase